MMNLYAIEMELNGKLETLLTLFDGPTMAELKNNKAILGMLKNPQDSIVHHNINYNPEFVDLFHKTMLFFAEMATGSNPITTNGFMYVIDERCINPESPEQKDIIGSFEVRAGQVLKETYQPNKHYQFISDDGLFKLPLQIEKVLFLALV